MSTPLVALGEGGHEKVVPPIFEIVRQLGDARSVAVNKANMGFALFGLGRIDAGKRLAEEAVAEYERAGASAETASPWPANRRAAVSRIVSLPRQRL